MHIQTEGLDFLQADFGGKNESLETARSLLLQEFNFSSFVRHILNVVALQYPQGFNIFSPGSGPRLSSFLGRVEWWVYCGVSGLIRLARKGMESHLSCQIQLRAPMASKRRDFPFSSL